MEPRETPREGVAVTVGAVAVKRYPVEA